MSEEEVNQELPLRTTELGEAACTDGCPHAQLRNSFHVQLETHTGAIEEATMESSWHVRREGQFCRQLQEELKHRDGKWGQ